MKPWAMLLLLLALPARAEPVEEMVRIAAQRVEALEASPDGESVLVVLRTRDPGYVADFTDVGHRILLHVERATGALRQLAADCEDVRLPVWSPDGRRIAHFASRNGVFGLAIRNAASDVTEQWIELTGEAANPIGEVAGIVWSDDGTRLVVIHDPDVSWREQFVRRASISIDRLPGPIVVDSRTSRTPLMSIQGFDGKFFGDRSKRVLVLESNGEVRPLPWSPSGEVTLLRLKGDRLVARAGNEIVALDLTSDAAPSPLAGDVVHAGPRFVLLRQDDRLQLRRLDERLQLRDVRTLATPPGTRIAGITGRGDLLGLDEKGMSSELIVMPSAGAGTRSIFGGEAVVRRTISSNGQTVWFVVTTATTPEELWACSGDCRTSSRVASLSDGSKADVKVETVRWTSSDGAEIEGLLLMPPGAATPLPTLLFLHGGPEDRIRFDYHYLASLHQGGAALALASRGWAVLLPNFRGSLGYGDEPRRALQNGRYISVPAADSLAGLDALVARQVADPTRLAAAGFSFGGTLTAWIIGRDHRFRAAVAMAGDLDLLQDDRTRLRGDRSMHALGGARSGPEDGLRDAWLAPEKYDELSPVESAVNVRTPVMILSTAAEQLAGTPEAAYFNGASLHGTPVRWVHYPAAWHGGSWSPADREDAMERVNAWLEEWVLTER